MHSKIHSIGSLAIFIALTGLANTAFAQEMQEVVVIRSGINSTCPKVEFIVDGVLHGNGIAFRNGSLSSVPNGAYKATVSRSGDILTFAISEPITRSFTLRARQGTAAEKAALNNAIQGWIDDPAPPHGAIFDLGVDNRECGLTGSLPNIDEMYESIFGSDNTSFSDTEVRLLFESYDSVVMRSQDNFDDFFEYKDDGTWVQMSQGTTVSTYQEIERSWNRISILDDQPIVVDVLGTAVEKPRLVSVPHDFKGWRPISDDFVHQWRPTTEYIYSIVRDRMAHSVTFDREMNLYSYIEQILSDETLETLVLSDQSNQRVGFDGNEDRFLILAYAQNIDGDFSQSPETLSDGAFLSSTKFYVEGECNGNDIATISITDSSIEFGPIVDGSGGADIPDDLPISKLTIEGVERDAAELEIWVQYNPGLPSAGTLDDRMPRECDMIWQKLNVRMFCSGSSLRQVAEVSGSMFSSALFLAGDYTVGHNFDSFESLWQCDENRPDFIK